MLLALLVPAAVATAANDEGIVGGNSTTIQKWPWTVAVYESGQPICGGTLVAPTVVVTAGHCVLSNNGQPLSAGRFSAVTGRTRLSTNEGQQIGVKKVHNFTDGSGRPLYNSQNLKWDVALLELKQPSTSRPIQIAGPDERQLWAAGRTAYATGWGATNPQGTQYPDGLREVALPIISDQKCRQDWGPSLSTSLMLCAGDGSAPKKDTCSGDSGGPLVVPMDGGGYRLVGDTSFGSELCGSGGVYGRLADDPMRTAIRNKALGISGVDVVGGDGTPPPGPGPTPGPTPTPTPPPTGSLTRQQANKAVDAFSRRACFRDRRCRAYYGGECRVSAGGFKCRAYKFDRSRSGRRFTLVRKVKVQEKAGAAALNPGRRWKKRRGWL